MKIINLIPSKSAKLDYRRLLPVYFYVVLILFLLEQVLNANFGYAISVPVVLLVICVLRTNLLLVNRFSVGKISSTVVITILTLYQFPSVLSSPVDCTLNVKFFAAIFILPLSVWAMWRLRPESIVFSNFGTKFILCWIIGSIFLAQLGFDIISILGGVESRIPSGFYFEPSHLALHLLPLMAFRLLKNFFDRLTWFALVVVFSFAPSTTLMIGLLGIIIFKLIMSVRSSWVVVVVVALFLSVVAFLSFVFEENSFIDRVVGVVAPIDGVITNLSSSVWLNGWSQAYEHFVVTNGWGVGLSRMGCGSLEMSGYLTPLIINNIGAMINSSDGSLLLAKMVAEFGFLGLLACFYLSLLAIKSIVDLRPIVLSNLPASISRDLIICRAAASLTLLIFFYVRGISYFSFPLMLSISMLLNHPDRLTKKSFP